MNERGDMAASTLAVVALVIAIIAGVLAWMAYDRTGANLDERIRNQIIQSTQGLENDVNDNSTAPTDNTGGSTGTDTTPGGTDTDINTETDTVPQTQP